ncbi:hypothetical protein EK904_014030 [Melospiza melodia maxima]|nr:hypothetical protein EK904_014030 [Melospiza melodia maxima]
MFVWNSAVISLQISALSWSVIPHTQKFLLLLSKEVCFPHVILGPATGAEMSLVTMATQATLFTPLVVTGRGGRGGERLPVEANQLCSQLPGVSCMGFVPGCCRLFVGGSVGCLMSSHPLLPLTEVGSCTFVSLSFACGFGTDAFLPLPLALGQQCCVPDLEHTTKGFSCCCCFSFPSAGKPWLCVLFVFWSSPMSMERILLFPWSCAVTVPAPAWLSAFLSTAAHRNFYPSSETQSRNDISLVSTFTSSRGGQNWEMLRASSYSGVGLSSHLGSAAQPCPALPHGARELCKAVQQQQGSPDGPVSVISSSMALLFSLIYFTSPKISRTIMKESDSSLGKTAKLTTLVTRNHIFSTVQMQVWAKEIYNQFMLCSISHWLQQTMIEASGSGCTSNMNNSDMSLADAKDL